MVSMSFVYDPRKILSRIAPKKKVEKLLSGKVSLKKTALSFVDDIDFIDKKRVSEVALKTIKGYKERIKDDKTAKAEILADPANLINRVQNEVVLQISEGIKEKYDGEFYIWLPSDADEPDPEHQLNYGKKFQIGDGEMPGERYGCRCGMEILTKDNQLTL
jgi:hypothetical protein